MRPEPVAIPLDGAADAQSGAEAMLSCLDGTDLITRSPTLAELLGAHPAKARINDDILRAFAALIIEGRAEPAAWQTSRRLGLALEIRTRLDPDAVMCSDLARRLQLV